MPEGVEQADLGWQMGCSRLTEHIKVSRMSAMPSHLATLILLGAWHWVG